MSTTSHIPTVLLYIYKARSSVNSAVNFKMASDKSLTTFTSDTVVAIFFYYRSFYLKSILINE